MQHMQYAEGPILLPAKSVAELLLTAGGIEISPWLDVMKLLFLHNYSLIPLGKWDRIISDSHITLFPR